MPRRSASAREETTAQATAIVHAAPTVSMPVSSMAATAVCSAAMAKPASTIARSAHVLHLTTQKSFYVEISRARDRAELVTDDAADLRAQLHAVTSERIAALEGIGEMKQTAAGKEAEAVREAGVQRDHGAAKDAVKDREGPAPARDREIPAPGRGRGSGMDLGL